MAACAGGGGRRSGPDRADRPARRADRAGGARGDPDQPGELQPRLAGTARRHRPGQCEHNVHLAMGGSAGRASRRSRSPASPRKGRARVSGLASSLARGNGLRARGPRPRATLLRLSHHHQRPGLNAVDMFRALGEGRIKALWVMTTNPAVFMPTPHVREALVACLGRW